MEALWSMSTTVREAERIVGFLKSAIELDGCVWNNDSQVKFQVLLIKNRQYLNDPDNTQTFNKLNNEQAALLKNKEIEMTYEQAKDIFDTKEYEDPPMRGRQSMAPLQKLGLVYLVENEQGDKIVTVTEVGKKLARGDIEFSDFMLDSLLKFQYPNPYESGFRTWHTKPFINTLRLIKKVNQLCIDNDMPAKGISTREFGIFALSLRSYTAIDDVANKIIEFRKAYERLPENQRDDFEESYIRSYLSEFQNPVKNVREYTDNMIRYLRLTKYIYIRGKYNHTYIDLEPRRMIEINSILEVDNGQPRTFTKEQWVAYMGNYGTYELPFETVDKLTAILTDINEENERLEDYLGLDNAPVAVPATKDALKETIEKQREYRTTLQNLRIKQDYHEDTSRIDTAIKALEDIRDHNKASLAKKYSIELEKWANVGLNIIDDCESIKPNTLVGDDDEPIYTAPAGVPDIECYYDSFGGICEVTTLTSRDQWYNEGQPVMRHLREFEDNHSTKPSYCLFIAPTLHVDTVNTFYTSVKYEYQGRKQKIIPITITQFVRILRVVKNTIESGGRFSNQQLVSFYDDCTNMNAVADSTAWANTIEQSLQRIETAVA